MNYQDIVKNPIVRIVATILILYFALFHNKKDPRSLSSRYSKENIEKNMHDAAAKKKEIQKKIYDAKQNKYKVDQSKTNKSVENNE